MMDELSRGTVGSAIPLGRKPWSDGAERAVGTALHPRSAEPEVRRSLRGRAGPAARCGAHRPLQRFPIAPRGVNSGELTERHLGEPSAARAPQFERDPTPGLLSGQYQGEIVNGA